MDSLTHAFVTLQACSACAGDYEDPERTSWNQREELRERDEEDDAEQPARDDFPV